MLRLTNKFKNLPLTKKILSEEYTNFQTVRWRKPRWIPQAKSKIFKIPKRHITPEEETIEMMRLNDNYRTEIKSIRRYLTYKYSTRYLASSDPEEQKKRCEEDFVRCLNINNKWNEQQRILREKRVSETLEAEIKFAKRRVELEVLKQEQKLQEVEEIVRREKEQAKNYITPKNIDAAIEHALANPVDYNFAIDLNGEKIIGRENNTLEVKKEGINIQ